MPNINGNKEIYEFINMKVIITRLGNDHSIQDMGC